MTFLCPDCPTARIVRASVYDERFWTYLIAIVLPLLVLGLISALLYRIGIERRPAPPPRGTGAGGKENHP